MKRIIATLLISLSATQASALSCGFGNTASAYQEATGYDLPFITVQGQFEMEIAGLIYSEEDYTLPARFEGVVIGADGRATPLQSDVKVIGTCINGDCGYVGAGDFDVITFLHQFGDDLIAYSMPCSGFPTGADTTTRDEILTCMNDGPCVAEFFNQ